MVNCKNCNGVVRVACLQWTIFMLNMLVTSPVTYLRGKRGRQDGNRIASLGCYKTTLEQ